jgi:Curlin associated repeat
VKPRSFNLSGAAVLAALIIAQAANAQVMPEVDLTGSLDLEPKLEGSSLFAESRSGSESNANRNITDIRQVGSGNTAEVSQTSSAYGAFTIIAQVGMDNVADVTQCGCSNFVDIVQDGTANVSAIEQTGRGNVFVHRQYGDGLSLSVAQYGGAQISVTQTGP